MSRFSRGSTGGGLTPEIEAQIQNQKYFTNLFEFSDRVVLVADGEDWQPAIQAAVDSLPLGGTVLIPPYVTTFDIYRRVTVPKNVNLFGVGGEIRRRFDRNVSSMAFLLQGNNSVINLKYNGGYGIVNFVSGEHIYYSDFAPNEQVEGVYLFEGNTFNDSCGSFIVGTGASNVKVVGNHFGDYLDHCVYFAGRGVTDTDKYNRNLVVTGNTIFAEASTTVRSAIKGRNGVYNYSITGNTFHIPNAVFCEVGNGDDISVRDSQNIAVTGNVGTCFQFLAIGYSGKFAMEYPVESITVNDNAVICSGPILEVGSLPGGTTTTDPNLQKGLYIKRMVLANNSFKGQGGLINGQVSPNHRGIESITYSNNDIHVIGTNFFFYPLGNVDTVHFKNNVFTFDVSGSVLISMYRQNTYPSFMPSIVGNWVVEGNHFKNGINRLYYENSTTATSTRMNLFILNNRIENTLTGKRLVQVVGTQVAAITSFLFAKDNYFLGGTVLASQFKTSNMIEENENQMTIKSPNGTYYKVTIDDTGVLTTAPIV